MVSYNTCIRSHNVLLCVLILIVVDNGLVRLSELTDDAWKQMCLNPYCSGQWSRTVVSEVVMNDGNQS